MNLEKYIRIKITELSKNYDVTLIEIQTAKCEKVSKLYKVYLRALHNDIEDIKEEFYSKRQLVSWLLCLK